LSAPYPPPAATPANDKTQLWGILGIVIGLLCCAPLGIVFGFLSVNEAKKSGKSPTLGYVAIALSALNIVVSIILVATGSYPGIN
jgi:integral membrane sensor domain MASE1